MLSKRVAATALEVQRRGVHEHHRELAEQVAPTREQLLLDEVLDAARRQRVTACSLCGSSSPSQAMAR